MKHARRTLRRIVRLAAVGGLLCGGLLVSNAVAEEPGGARAGGNGASGTPGTSGVSGAAATGAGLVERLGPSRTAGTWIGSDGLPVVAVTDEAAADEVRRAGARPQVMRYSMRELRSATETLSRSSRVAGTAWAVDYASNKVVVRADSTVSAADWSRMSAVARDIGGSVEMRRTEGTFTTRVNGAAPILTNGGRCSAGFNVTNGAEQFILTAGHCGPVGTGWFAENLSAGQIGTTVAGRFPGNDFSLVRYEEGAAPGADANIVDIGNGQAVRVTGAADPVVGQQVFRSGSTTGLRSGQVTALNATVNYREGSVSGLIETTVCAEPGDSGGPLLAEGIALGITSGGSGDCTSGGTTFFEPVTSAMNALGVRLTGAATAAGEAGGGAREGGEGGASDAAPAPSVPAAGGIAAPGPGAQRTVTGIVDLETLIPGLVLIVVSVLGLAVAQSIRTEKASYRNQYSQSWG
ncbi:S1 family peptidase [Streptomyces hebeiensis]